MQNDAELIRRTLDGDETAFTMLVKKYQKHVHALVWRKIGDFHIAEDITQETLLKVHQNLATLKEPDRFPGWLYVIATRCCIARLRKKRLHAQLVEDIDLMRKGKDIYSQHVADEQAKTTTEMQREVVKELLAKLQESDRTILTLYYFGEMTCEEISKFLGVSANTIKSRLSRARQRLKKEEPLIQEALGTFQISPNLTQNIVQAVKEKGGSLKPVSPKGSKPLVPWAAVASTAIVALLIFGTGNEYIARFQQPYSLEATSEMKVDIVEAPATAMKQVKPAVKTQQSTLSRKSTRDLRSRQKADAGNNPPTLDSRKPIANSQQPTEEIQQTQLEVLDFFRMPESGHLDYTVVHIDATAFEDGGTLTIDIRVGSGEAAGSFDLFDGDRKLPTGGIRRSSNALAHQWGIPPGGTGTITYQFDQGQVFRLGAASDWQSEKGSTNTFYARISIAKQYRLFLSEWLEGKRPRVNENTPMPLSSSRRVVLDRIQPAVEVLDTFRYTTATQDDTIIRIQDDTIIRIDATAFENGGTLTIAIQVGRGALVGSFDLFSGDSVLPTEGTPQNALAQAWGIQPGETGTITYRFDKGQVFQLRATGGWVNQTGGTNAFRARISVR